MVPSELRAKYVLYETRINKDTVEGRYVDRVNINMHRNKHFCEFLMYVPRVLHAPSVSLHLV
jgi:hypothetical protein